MDFKIEINGETKIFSEYYPALDFINEKMAYWNNFEPDKTMYIRITKTENEIQTLAITTVESVKMKDRMA